MAFDLSKKRQEAAATGKDLTKPTAGGGGGDYTPPAEGPTRLRLVGYVETGVHTSPTTAGPKTKPRVELHFELSGPKHEAKDVDGKKYAQRLKIKEVLGTHEKNNFIKLFNVMNVDGDARNFIDLLMDKAWRGTVTHSKFKARDGSERVAAYLKPKAGGYQIFPVSFEDPETGETRTVSVPPAISELRIFLWDDGDVEQWDTLDKFSQSTIRKAENFTGSPIFNALIEAGREADTVEPKDEEQGADEAPAQDEAPAPAPATPPATKPKAAKAAAKAPAAKAPAPASPDGDPLQGL